MFIFLKFSFKFKRIKERFDIKQVEYYIIPSFTSMELGSKNSKILNFFLYLVNNGYLSGHG